jgi:hypothetical protein
VLAIAFPQNSEHHAVLDWEVDMGKYHFAGIDPSEAGLFILYVVLPWDLVLVYFAFPLVT